MAITAITEQKKEGGRGIQRVDMFYYIHILVFHSMGNRIQIQGVKVRA